jgi:hypothetical protein
MPRSCGTVQNFFRQVDLYPAMRRNQAMLESMTASAARRSLAAAPVFPRKIPVVVHVLHEDAADNISDDQVASQIKVLTEDFAGKNNDSSQVPAPFKEFVGNPGLEFFLAKVDPSGAATNGITRRQTSAAPFGVDDSMKADASGGRSPWDTARYLNIWVCQLSGGVLGYAQFPGGPPETDGVVILTSAFGSGGSAAAPFDLGRTTTHEVGHYLNLSHIWGEARLRRRHAEPVRAQLRQADLPFTVLREHAARRHVRELHGLCRRRHDVHVHQAAGLADACGPRVLSFEAGHDG